MSGRCSISSVPGRELVAARAVGLRPGTAQQRQTMSCRFHLALHSAVLVTVLACAPVRAQAPSPSPSPLQTQTPSAPPQTLDPKPCSDPAIETRRNSNPSAQGTEGNAAGRTLSEKLDSSNGVICPPPDVDPSIKAPTPNVGTTPIIPPPGSPGGDPTIRPK
jgi:hypothetical protein